MATLFSFLGIKAYDPVRYSFEGKTSGEHRYTQAALVELLDPKPDRICVALTELARKHNFEGMCAALRAAGFDEARIQTIDIEDGKDEDQLWEVFEKLAELRDSEVIFDCTFGFRVLPLMATLALPFHGQSRQLRISRMLYGVLEKELFVDMTAMLDLPTWTEAVNTWDRDGVGRGLEARLAGPIESLRKLIGGDAPRELRGLPGALGALSDRLSVVKLSEIPRAARRVQDILFEAARQIEVHPETKSLRPFKLIVDRLRASVAPLAWRDGVDPDDLRLELVRWYIDRERFGAAYTAMRELITDVASLIANAAGVSAVHDRDGALLDATSVEARGLFDVWVMFAARGDVPDVSEQNAPLHERIVAHLATSSTLMAALEEADQMRDTRNKILHGWTGVSAREKITRDPDGTLMFSKKVLVDLERTRAVVTAWRQSRPTA